MLDPAEAAAVAERFSVSDAQVRRDHLLSHLIALLARDLPDSVVFFGGTALARTHLPEGRLSEDLDLFAIPRRVEVVTEIEQLLADGLRREYGRLLWDVPLSMVRGTDPATLRTSEGLAVRVQLLDPANHPSWPTERRAIVQRYSDVPPATLAVPTLPAFAASKTAAWHDRHLPRDLYDLWGLSRLGALDAAAARLFAQHGPTGHTPRGWMFRDAPNTQDWITHLAAQTRVAIGSKEALTAVREAWSTVRVDTDN